MSGVLRWGRLVMPPRPSLAPPCHRERACESRELPDAPFTDPPDAGMTAPSGLMSLFIEVPRALPWAEGSAALRASEVALQGRSRSRSLPRVIPSELASRGSLRVEGACESRELASRGSSRVHAQVSPGADRQSVRAVVPPRRERQGDLGVPRLRSGRTDEDGAGEEGKTFAETPPFSDPRSRPSSSSVSQRRGVTYPVISLTSFSSRRVYSTQTARASPLSSTSWPAWMAALRWGSMESQPS